MTNPMHFSVTSLLFSLISVSRLLVLPVAAEPKWETDLETALSRAAEGKKRVLLDYYAAWCPPCQDMDKEVWRKSALGAQEGEFVFVHLDGDRLPKGGLHKKYPILGYPTVWIIGADGKAQGRYVGFETAPQFLEFISETLAGHDRTAELEVKVSSGTDDPSLLLEAIGAYLIKGDHKKAAQLKNKIQAASVIGLKGPKKDDWEGVYDRALLDESAAMLYGEEPKYAEAAKLAEAAYRELPKSPLAPSFLHLRAKALRGQGKAPDADKIMAGLTGQFPKSASAAWRVLEYARLNRALAAEAEKAMEDGLKAFPKNERFLNQVVLFIKDRDPKRAAAVAGQLKAIKPDNAYYDELIRELEAGGKNG